jgi:Meiotically up-regulated gene 113
MKSWIYFVRYGEEGPIKIGRADDPKRRVASLEVSTPMKLILLGAMLSEQAQMEEEALHRRLHKHRIRGEWFDAKAVLAEMELLESRLVPAEQTGCQYLDNPWSRSEIIHIRVTPEEITQWRAFAQAQNKSLSAWIRDLVNPFADCIDEEETCP